MTATSALILSEVPRLKRYAAALFRDRDGADDLVQHTVLRALEKSHLWQPGTNLRAWLFTLMHNLYVNYVRGSVREGQKINLERINPSTGPGQIWSLTIRDLKRGLARLPEEQRTVLWSIGVNGMKYEQAAQIYSVPIGTIRSRLSRARQALNAILDGESNEAAEDRKALEVTPRRAVGDEPRRPVSLYGP
jgi:RNA polymerase sigma-70 factor, ECF subfamily